MKVEQQPAYLLHARPFSESSLLVDLFTREHGRLMTLAKGARRGKSRTRGALLPFRPLLVSWAGKGQLPTLTSVEEQRGQRALMTARMKGATLASGFYLNELLLRLLHRFDAHETLFEHYHHAITQLAEAHSPRPVLRIFEKKLLHDIGFGAALEHDADTFEPICARQQYRYVLEKGPVRITPLNESSGEQVNEAAGEWALTVSGRALCALREEKFESDDELRETQRLTRTLLDRQLNGRALRSRRVAIEMTKYSAGA